MLCWRTGLGASHVHPPTPPPCQSLPPLLGGLIVGLAGRWSRLRGTVSTQHCVPRRHVTLIGCHASGVALLVISSKRARSPWVRLPGSDCCMIFCSNPGLSSRPGPPLSSMLPAPACALVTMAGRRS